MKDNNLVTKQDLEKALGEVEKRFLGEMRQTKEEFLEEVRQTKEEFIREVRQTKEEFLQKVKEFRDEVEDFKNETFNRLDAVMGELQTLREEQIIHFARHEEIEERLNRLESPKAT